MVKKLLIILLIVMLLVVPFISLPQMLNEEETTTNVNTSLEIETTIEESEYIEVTDEEIEAPTETTTETTEATEEETEVITTEELEVTEETTVEENEEVIVDVEVIVKESNVVEGDLGIFKIPSVNINVGLYAEGNAFQSSGKASVQYYQQYGICWIADHVNQDNFGNLRYVSIGDYVYVNDSCYVVSESIYYDNFYSDFYNCGFLGKLDYYCNIGGLVIQTCEGNGARIVYCTKN